MLLQFNGNINIQQFEDNLYIYKYPPIFCGFDETS